MIRCVAVAGLGLIGGSAARRLASSGVRVLGWDRDAAAVDAALAEGVLAAVLGDDLAGVEEADALLLAVPVRAAPALLEAALPRLGSVRLVTDAGSTKASIVTAAERLGIGDRFVGAHPLAGSHESGWSAARGDLFDGATVYLCRTSQSTDSAFDAARELWTLLGGVPLAIGADEHDLRLGWTSHLPQMVSTVLGSMLAAEGISRGELGPGGRDVTRLAASSPEMWTDIVMDNQAAISQALSAAEAELRGVREAAAHGDANAIFHLFQVAQDWARDHL